MKNDLTTFEKNLLRQLNFIEGTKYNYQHLMEWSNSRATVDKNLKADEKVYEVNGIYIAIKP
jgi:sulfur transfer protein SufE